MFRTPLASAVAIAACLATTASAQVKLESKRPENTTTVYKTTSKIHQILNLNGMDIETNAVETVISSQAYGAKRADGTQPMVQKIDSLKAQIDLPMGMNISFDSANPEANKADNPILENIRKTLKAMPGAAYTVVFDKDGKVVAVEGTEKLLDQADDLDPMAKEGLKKRFSAEKLTKAHQQEEARFPEILVKKGEPWDRTETMDLGEGQTMTFKKRYEYLGATEMDGKALDKIGVKSTEVTYAMEPNSQSPLRVTKSDLKIDSSEGTLLFDRAAGRVVQGGGKTVIKGDMTMEIQGTELPAKLDLTIESETELQSSSK